MWEHPGSLGITQHEIIPWKLYVSIGTVPERELVKWPSPWVKQKISVILELMDDPLIALSFAPLPDPPMHPNIWPPQWLVQEESSRGPLVWPVSTLVSPTDVCAGFVGKDIVFRFIIECISSRDFGSEVIGLFLYEDFWKMIFWLVLKLEISYRVIISWRILVSFGGFALKIIFLHGEIFVFP